MLVIFLCIILLMPVREAAGQYHTVKTSKGYVRGFNQSQTMRYLGIPYATAQRFQYPSLDLPPWSGVRNASAVGAMCYQHCISQMADLYCLPEMAEDCLTLNVFRPAFIPTSGDLFPVIVYIHGGDFSSGSGAAPIYDGDYFASRGRVIVVTLNYRLGAFGFLSIFDKYGDAAGNFGFRDQQVALTWIKENIAAFNGDPDKITLMGDGAGCLSIVAHLASPTSKPLFNSAILQSCPLNVPFRTRTQARLQAEAFSNALGCGVNDVSCYRSKMAYDVLHAQMAVSAESYTQNQLMTFFPWGPTVDDHEIYYGPLDIFKDLSRFESKPLIIGTVADEGVNFVYRKFTQPISVEEFNSFVSSVTSGTSTVTTSGEDLREALVSFVKKHVFACPSLFAARQMLKKQALIRSLPSTDASTQDSKGQVWLYQFHTPTNLPTSLNEHQQHLTNALWPSFTGSADACDKRACHGSDVRAIFNSDALPLVERLKVETLAKQVVRYWSNFARSNSVNGIISSRAHLRTLQLHSALLSDSQPFSPRMRPRAQRISFPSLGLEGGQLVTPIQIALQSALASFTYWPNYTTISNRGAESESAMIFQTPPLVVRRFYWNQICSSWTP